jgi:hypothetical protein
MRAALTLALAAALGSPDNPYHGRSGQLQVATPRTDADIRIDGNASEDVWGGAALLTGFSQYTPVDGVPAADSTEVRVIYDDHAIYFAIRAFEPHGAVNATRADRDKIASDDHIRLFIDTFNDRRRAFLFSVNPFGVQSDGTFADNASGGVTDLNPDYTFESKGRLTEYGYEVEVRIPFKSIRYQQTGSREQQWGLSVIRMVQHSGHEQSWTPANRQNPSYLAQQGTLMGLRDLRRGLVLDVNPVMTAQSVGVVRSTTDPTWTYRGQDPQYSGNLRWGATQSLTVSGTVNPDFSQIEADVGQVVFDPRAAISFPEKRPFFLEASENFDVPSALIYTRSIADPVAAAKMAGKIGGLNVGILSAVDDEAVSASGADNPVFTVARLKRDFARQSTAGLVFTDRSEAGEFNRVAGADTRVVLGGWQVNGQLASSFTSTASSSAGKMLWDVNAVKAGRARGFSGQFRGVDPEFIAGSGFISRAGVVRANAAPRWSWFPARRRVEAISFAPALDLTWEWDRFMDGKEWNDIKFLTTTNVSLRGGWRYRFFTWLESFKWPSYLYTNYFVEMRDASGAVTDTVPFVGHNRLPNYGFDTGLNTPQWKTFSASLGLTAGHDDNFDEWSSALIWFTTFNADWRPTDRLRFNGRVIDQRFYRRSDRSLVRERMIPRLKMEYQVSRPIFVRLVTQYDAFKLDSLRDDSRSNFPVLFRNPDGTYRRSVARQRSGLRSDVLFSYQPTPGTVFFAGYGASHVASEFLEPSLLDRTDDAFFIKASYLIRY